MSYSSLMRFDVGMVRGSCIINYRPPQYEPPNMICCPEEVEFTHVEVNGRDIPFADVNETLNNIMLEAFEEHRGQY